MLKPSEEVTKTWVKRKGLLIKSRPMPSRFSFAVCLALVISIAFGFLSGFITAGYALSENYSSVYENLLTELENTRRCVEREKEQLLSVKKDLKPKGLPALAAPSLSKTLDAAHGVPEQAIYSAFNHAVDLLLKNEKNGGCEELKNIINLNEYSGEWKHKARYLLNKNCH